MWGAEDMCPAGDPLGRVSCWRPAPLGLCMGCSTLSSHPVLLPRDAVPSDPSPLRALSATALHQGSCLCPPALGLLTCLHRCEERTISGPLSLENSRF